MSAYAIDYEQIKILMEAERRKLNKPHPIVHTENEIIDTYMQVINLESWKPFLFKSKFNFDVIEKGYI